MPSNSGGLVRVCGIAELPDPGKAIVRVGERTLALFRIAGRFWATDDRCTHDGGSLANGRLEGYIVICPRHGARFDVRTGEVFAGPASVRLAVHEVRVEGNHVFVRVIEDL